MQSLLYDRKVGRILPLEFAKVLSESGIPSLRQNIKTDVFPVNCHRNASVNSISLENQDYQYLLTGGADSSIKLWDLLIQEKCHGLLGIMDPNDEGDYDNPVSAYSNIATIPRKMGHQFGISCIQWWPFDTGMFVSSSFDHYLKIWDTNELEPVHDFDLDNRIYSFDIRNTLIATASDQPFIRLLDLRSTSSAQSFSGHKNRTLSVKWHPKDPNILASGGLDGEVKIWDIRRSKACLCRLDMLRTNSSLYTSDNLTRTSVKAHLGPVNGLVWDPLGHTLFTAGNDDKVRAWDMIGSFAPPINKLINFGPLTRNKYMQTIPITLNYRYESELQYLIFPSDSGDIYIFRTVDGKVVTRLNRKGSKTLGRSCSIANGPPFLNTFYAGTMDGEILAFSLKTNSLNFDDIIDQNIPDLSDNGSNLISGAKEFLNSSSSIPLDIDKIM